MMRLKVLAYITREHHGQMELLVFTQRGIPEAGLQVPGGGIEPGEPFLDALRREVAEESGLTTLGRITPLCDYVFYSPVMDIDTHSHVYHVEVADDLPDTWEHLVTGGGIDDGVTFEYRWMPLTDAQSALIGDLGRSLHLIMA
jgi:8-oxo-dGTP pyrophosphatase MutT (NUDIX family)